MSPESSIFLVDLQNLGFLWSLLGYDFHLKKYPAIPWIESRAMYTCVLRSYWRFSEPERLALCVRWPPSRIRTQHCSYPSRTSRWPCDSTTWWATFTTVASSTPGPSMSIERLASATSSHVPGFFSRRRFRSTPTHNCTGSQPFWSRHYHYHYRSGWLNRVPKLFIAQLTLCCFSPTLLCSCGQFWSLEQHVAFWKTEMYSLSYLR